LRLVVEFQFVPLQRAAQGVLQLQAAAGGGVHLLGVEAEGVAAGALGFVHGGVGVSEQRLDAVAVAREQADAEAGRAVQRTAVEIDRRRQGADQLLRHPGEVLLLGDVRQDNGELVAADPRHQVVGAQRQLQPPCQFAQHPVASLVAEAVVDVLEAIEVDQHHRQDLLALGVARQGPGQALLQQGAVGQAGQGIEIGRLVQRRLGFLPAPPIGRLGELALDGRAEPAEGVLEHVVLGAGAHGADGDVLADVARDDDERQVGGQAADDVQRQQAAEIRHGVVGNDDVPAAGLEGPLQGLGVIDALTVGLEAGLSEDPDEQQGVVVGVLDDQQAQRPQGLGGGQVHAAHCAGRLSAPKKTPIES
jgi:hypothetical protein